MRANANDLARHLKQGIKAVYIVSGDEPLQSNEALDLIRATARDQDFSSRVVLDVTTGFDWNLLAAEADSLSLFSEKKIIDLRILNGKPGREGGAALTAYCNNLPVDTVLLVSLPKLDRNQQGSKWLKALEGAGLHIQVWPIDRGQLPRWISQRMQTAGLKADRDVAEILSDRVEGNLLAANQEIEKLLLLFGEGNITAEQLTGSVADSARYDVFTLVDNVLAGKAGKGLHILAGLRAEGIASSIVLWALAREIRSLVTLAQQVASGISPQQAVAHSGVWAKRQPLVQMALQRLRPQQLLKLLGHCHTCDLSIKGAELKDPWLQLEQIVFRLSAQPTMRRSVA